MASDWGLIREFEVTELMANRLPGLAEAQVDGELVALHIENGTYYSFNETAARIWALLERPKSVAELCAALAAEFEVDEDACREEIILLLKDLETDGLVDLVPADPAPA
jgi:hypothetical protein